MSVIRVSADRPENNFTIIRNATLRDYTLTLRARGLLAYLLSLPPDTATSTLRLAGDMIEGRDAIRAAMGELERHGYVTRLRRRGPSGKWEHTLVVSSVPTVA